MPIIQFARWFDKPRKSALIFQKFKLKGDPVEYIIRILLHFAELLLRFQKRRVMCFESSGRFAFALQKRQRMKYVAVVLFVSLIGCATSEETTIPDSWPEVISMASLPPLAQRELKLKAFFLVLDDGSVADVKLRGTSGDPHWDTLATESMKQWQFTPAVHDSSPNGRWIPERILVESETPVVITLSEIVASSMNQADSLYSLLRTGVDFDSLAGLLSKGSSGIHGKFLGTIDIVQYPKHIRDELRKLNFNDITRPLRLGADYIIYKRYDPERVRRILQ